MISFRKLKVNFNAINDFFNLLFFRSNGQTLF